MKPIGNIAQVSIIPAQPGTSTIEIIGGDNGDEIWGLPVIGWRVMTRIDTSDKSFDDDLVYPIPAGGNGHVEIKYIRHPDGSVSEIHDTGFFKTVKDWLNYLAEYHGQKIEGLADPLGFMGE